MQVFCCWCNNIKTQNEKTHESPIYVLNFFNLVQGYRQKNDTSELKTLEWNILNPDRLINLEINNKR